MCNTFYLIWSKGIIRKSSNLKTVQCLWAPVLQFHYHSVMSVFAPFCNMQVNDLAVNLEMNTIQTFVCAPSSQERQRFVISNVSWHQQRNKPIFLGRSGQFYNCRGWLWWEVPCVGFWLVKYQSTTYNDTLNVFSLI